MTDEELWDLEWGDAVTVVAVDYTYEGRLLSVFNKIKGITQCCIEDELGRVFIHNAVQVRKCDEKTRKGNKL